MEFNLKELVEKAKEKEKNDAQNAEGKENGYIMEERNGALDGTSAKI